MFGLFKKKEAPAATPGEGEGQAGGDVLLLHLSNLGWQARIIDASGEFKGERMQGEAVELKAEHGERVKAIAKDAIETIPKRVLKEVDQISILLDGGRRQVFTDAKATELAAASPATARQFGQRLLNSQHVTFGYADYGAPVDPQLGGGRKNGLYGFADVRTVRDWLSAFDFHGTKIVEAVSSEYLILQRARDVAPGECYAALLFNAFTVTILVANYAHGNILVRNVEGGIMNMVRAAAEKNSISEGEALSTLTGRDLLSGLSLDASSEEEDPELAALLGMDPFAEAIKPLLAKLSREISNTFDFFDHQRGGGRPGAVECFGDHHRLQGMLTALTNGTGSSLYGAEFSLLDYFAQQRPMPYNLLKGSDVPLLTVGKTRFSFSEKGFVTSQKRQEQLASGGVATTKRTRPKPGERRRRREEAKKGGFFASLSARMAKRKQEHSMDEDMGPSAEDEAKRQVVIALGGLALVIAFFLWDSYESTAKKYTTFERNFKSGSEKNVKVRDTYLQKNRMQFARVSSDDIDKVLWSEKFLALSDNISDAIWLTDIYLESKRVETHGGGKVEGSQLVMRGAVLPSTDGHIQRISEFVETLIKDEKHFMKDFSIINFEGARLQDAGSDQIVTFSLVAVYDRLKHVEAMQKEEGGDGPGGLAEMQNNIRKKNEMLESIPGAPKPQ